MTRQGAYFWSEVALDNSTGPVWGDITVNAGTYQKEGGVFLPQSGTTQATREQFTHDADGNLTQDGRWNYTWDAENRLVQIVKRFPATDQSTVYDPVALTETSFQKVTYEYDWQGRRIAKRYYETTGSSTPFMTERFVYDGWNMIFRLDGAAQPARFVWGLDLSDTLQGAGGVGGLLWMRVGPAPQFCAYDGNGNVMAMVEGNNGNTTANYEYGPFGELIRINGVNRTAEKNPFRFSTKYQDDESGLLYYGYRHYSPSTGRWLSRDPIEEDGGFNLYGFVGNNPATATDKLGLKLLLEAHPVALGKNHSKLTIIPDNQACWAYDGRFKHNRTDDNRAYATIGAGPEELPGKGHWDYLVSNVNRKTDLDRSRNIFSKEIPPPEGMSEFAFILLLFATDASYPDNLDYEIFPKTWSDGYNSNSYISGFLRALHLQAPQPPSTPGFEKPVPNQYFQMSR